MPDEAQRRLAPTSAPRSRRHCKLAVGCAAVARHVDAAPTTTLIHAVQRDEMMIRAVQRFEVSLKLFIVRGGRALFVREADSGFWELPGGRIDVGEEWRPHDEVLAREIAEELGGALKVRLGTEAVTWTRLRPSDGQFLLLIARLGHIEAGEPELSGEHDALAWCGCEEAGRLAFPPLSGYGEAVSALWQLAGHPPIS
jgi:8-oxo-dGTP pyrophosphatase MutT (NUDIX family)